MPICFNVPLETDTLISCFDYMIPKTIIMSSLQLLQFTLQLLFVQLQFIMLQFASLLCHRYQYFLANEVIRSDL